MADFEYEGVSAEFSNTFADNIALSAFLETFKLPQQPPTDADGKPTETGRRSWLRSFCIIAAHAKNVRGLGDWQPPDMLADETTIKASAILFLSLANVPMIIAWTNALTEALFGAPAIVPEEARGGGDDAENFTESPPSSSGSDS